MFLMKCIANELFFVVVKPKSTLNCSGELGPGIVYHISNIRVEGGDLEKTYIIEHRWITIVPTHVVVQLMVHIAMF